MLRVAGSTSSRPSEGQSGRVGGQTRGDRSLCDHLRCHRVDGEGVVATMGTGNVMSRRDVRLGRRGRLARQRGGGEWVSRVRRSQIVAETGVERVRTQRYHPLSRRACWS